jgi:hypothetical protein
MTDSTTRDQPDRPARCREAAAPISDLLAIILDDRAVITAALRAMAHDHAPQCVVLIDDQTPPITEADLPEVLFHRVDASILADFRSRDFGGRDFGDQKAGRREILVIDDRLNPHAKIAELLAEMPIEDVETRPRHHRDETPRSPRRHQSHKPKRR